MAKGAVGWSPYGVFVPSTAEPLAPVPTSVQSFPVKAISVVKVRVPMLMSTFGKARSAAIWGSVLAVSVKTDAVLE